MEANLEFVNLYLSLKVSDSNILRSTYPLTNAWDCSYPSHSLYKTRSRKFFYILMQSGLANLILVLGLGEVGEIVFLRGTSLGLDWGRQFLQGGGLGPLGSLWEKILLNIFFGH